MPAAFSSTLCSILYSSKTASSFLQSKTAPILLAEAAHFVNIIKILESDIIAIEISVKYCIKAITVAGDDLPALTRYALTATTPTIPKFISIVIAGFTIAITVPAFISSFCNFLLALSYLAFSNSFLDKAFTTLMPCTSSLTIRTILSADSLTFEYMGTLFFDMP